MHIRVAHGLEEIGDWRTERAQWPQNSFSGLQITAVTGGNAHNRVAIRQREHSRHQAKFVRTGRRVLAEEAEHLRRLLDRVSHQTGQHRAQGMKLVLKGSDYAKVAAAAAHTPEEIRILLGAGGE